MGINSVVLLRLDSNWSLEGGFLQRNENHRTQRRTLEAQAGENQ